MNKTIKMAGFALLFTGAMAFAADSPDVKTSNISVTIGAEAQFAASIADVNLVHSGAFTDFTGVTSYGFKLRTSASGGSGTVTVSVAEFTGTGTLPAVAADLSITTATVSDGVGITSATALAANAAKTVATFGPDTHATAGTGQVNWKLLDDPNYSTGSPTTVVTYTISAS
jgi:hypothetical protein